MTLSDLLAAVSADCGYEAIPSAVVTARLTRYINDSYRQILSMPEMSPLRFTSLTFNSVPGRTVYGIPQAFVQLNQLVDATNNIRLRLMTLDQFRTIDPQEVSSGTPTHYIPVGFHPVQFQPHQATIYVASSSPLDTTQTLRVQGVLNYDNVDASVVTWTVTLNGTTPVAIAPSIQAIQTVNLSPVAVGSVQLWDVPVPDQQHRILTLNPGVRSVQYYGIRLWPTPAGIYTYTVDGDLSIIDLSTTNDLPVLPEDFQDILTDAARMREYEYRDDSRFPMAQAGYQEKLKQLRNRVCFPPDFKPRVGRIPDRSSNLSGYFPPGRW